MEDIALGDAETLFEIDGRQHAAGDDRAGHVRRELPNEFGDPVAEHIALFMPAAVSQTVRQVLHETGEHVPAFRRKRIVDVGGQHAVHPEALR